MTEKREPTPAQVEALRAQIAQLQAALAELEDAEDEEAAAKGQAATETAGEAAAEAEEEVEAARDELEATARQVGLDADTIEALVSATSERTAERILAGLDERMAALVADDEGAEAELGRMAGRDEEGTEHDETVTAGEAGREGAGSAADSAGAGGDDSPAGGHWSQRRLGRRPTA